MQSTKEREEKKLNEEIQALLVTQTAKVSPNTFSLFLFVSFVE